jgi:hypothetical protein
MRSHSKLSSSPTGASCKSVDEAGSALIDRQIGAFPTQILFQLSVIALLSLVGVLIYAILHIAMRGWILLVAVGAFVLSAVLFQVIRMTSAAVRY